MNLNIEFFYSWNYSENKSDNLFIFSVKVNKLQSAAGKNIIQKSDKSDVLL